MLNAMSARDPHDPASSERPETIPDYAANLDANALNGTRIGVLRTYGGAGANPYIERVFEDAIEALKDQGATVIDPIELDTEGLGDAEYEVLLYEFRADLNAYLESSGAPLKSIDDIIAFNRSQADSVMPYFGQEHMELAADKGALTDEAYLEALRDSKTISRRALEGALDEHQLDALIAPTNGPAWKIDLVNSDHFSVGSSSLAAVSGYASITVPAGSVFGLPIGVSFIGGAFSEQRLIPLAYAFEQATRARQAPLLTTDGE